MNETKRYFFRSRTTGKTTIIESPERHPGFYGFQRDGAAAVLIEGALLFGKPLRAVRDASVNCTASCKAATLPECTCSCGGENHGISLPHTDRK